MDYKQLGELLAATLNPQMRQTAELKLRGVRSSAEIDAKTIRHTNCDTDFRLARQNELIFERTDDRTLENT